MRPWLLYALWHLGTTIPGQAFATYLAFFYVDRLGLAASAFALARLIYALWDAVNDPLFGYLSDRTQTPWGRRRPWLLGGLVGLLLAFYLTFGPPEALGLSGEALFWYALGAILLFETFGAITWVNYSALFPELFQDLRARARANAWRQGLYFLGLAVGIALTPLVYGALGFGGMALLYALLGGALALPFLLALREEGAPRPRPGFLEALKRVVVRRGFWSYALAQTLVLFAVGLIAAGMPFYAKYALGLGEGETALLFAAVLLGALPSVPLWAWLGVGLGPRWGWLLAMGLLGLASLLLCLPQGFLEALFIGVLVGGAFGGVVVLGDLLFAELIDRDRMETGEGREAMYYSVYGFINRLSGPLQALAFALLTLLFGYVSGEEPGPNPERAFRFLMALLPGLAALLAVVLGLRFPYGLRPAQS